MSKKQVAKINHSVLKEIIEVNNYNIEMLAEELRPDLSWENKNTFKREIEGWIKGKKYPAWSDVEKISKIFEYPIPYFWLPFVVKEYTNPGDITKDYRKKKTMTPKLRALILEASLIINSYKELNPGIEDKDFVDKFSTKTPINEIVKYISENFSVPRGRVKKAETYYKRLVEKLEDKGILVIQKKHTGNYPSKNNKISTKLLAGFSISDKKAPLIFIHPEYIYPAKNFTLYHELTHILLGQGGIDEVGFEKFQNIEKLCDKVAARVLMPEEEFKSSWNDLELLYDDKDKIINELKQEFFVSKSAVVYRAAELKLIPKKYKIEFFNKGYENLIEKRQKGKNTGGVKRTKKSYYRTLSKQLVEATLQALTKNQITYTEATKILQLPVKTVMKLL